MERMYGIAVDQVLEIEMVLADERHVRFQPREWQDEEGFLYPKTTDVGGYCDTALDDGSLTPVWGACDDPVPPFEDLWFAVRGGSGGCERNGDGRYFRIRDHRHTGGRVDEPVLQR